MERRIEYTISEADYLSGTRRYTWRAYRKRGPLIALAVVWVIYVFIATWPWDRGWLRFGIGAGIATVVTVLIAVGIVLTNRLIMPRRVRKLYAQHRQLQLPQTATWDDAGIALASDTGSNRLAWADFSKWDDSGDGLMLYANDILYYLVPHRATSAEQRADIIALLTAAGVPNG